MTEFALRIGELISTTTTDRMTAARDYYAWVARGYDVELVKRTAPEDAWEAIPPPPRLVFTPSRIHSTVRGRH